MCYSSLLLKSYTAYAKANGAAIDYDAFVDLVQERTRSADIKIPQGLTQQLIDIGGNVGKSVEKACRTWNEMEQVRIQAEIAETEVAIATLEGKKPGKTRDKDLAAKLRKRERLMASLKHAEPSLRIYPYFYAPVMVERDGKRLITPMRYRLLPRTGVEMPSQYNVFNARRDSLQSARTWKPIFGANHAIFPFQRFYEWVKGPTGRPVEVSFKPDGFDVMWAASLYEETPQDGRVIRSFAMVTDEPPPEVAEAGHDRCPVFLDSHLVGDWLKPNGRPLDELDALLDRKEPTYYQHMPVAA